MIQHESTAALTSGPSLREKGADDGIAGWVRGRVFIVMPG